MSVRFQLEKILITGNALDVTTKDLQPPRGLQFNIFPCKFQFTYAIFFVTKLCPVALTCNFELSLKYWAL